MATCREQAEEGRAVRVEAGATVHSPVGWEGGVASLEGQARCLNCSPTWKEGRRWEP